MSWDTNQVTRNAMACGEKSRSSSNLQKGSLPLTYTRRPGTTPLPNSGGRLTAFFLTFFLASFATLLATCNDDYYLDTEHDFTSDLNEMRTALERIDARGSTALYDAVIGSLDHLKKGTRDKKVILVVTDGEDNASRHSLENTVEQAQRNNALIYAVGVFSDDDIKHNRRAMKKARTALTELANATGGLAFFPEDASDTESICTQIAHDIRNQYTLAYYPTNTAHDGTFRSVQVDVIPPRGAGKLSVRTRTGYYASRAPSSGN